MGDFGGKMSREGGYEATNCIEVDVGQQYLQRGRFR